MLPSGLTLMLIFLYLKLFLSIISPNSGSLTIFPAIFEISRCPGGLLNIPNIPKFLRIKELNHPVNLILPETALLSGGEILDVHRAACNLVPSDDGDERYVFA